MDLTFEQEVIDRLARIEQSQTDCGCRMSDMLMRLEERVADLEDRTAKLEAAENQQEGVRKFGSTLWALLGAALGVFIGGII